MLTLIITALFCEAGRVSLGVRRGAVCRTLADSDDGRPPAGRRTRQSKVDDRGVFILSLAGREIGTESFSIRTLKDKIEAKAEIQLQIEQGGRTIELKSFPDLVLSSGFEPLTYSWAQKGAQSSRLEIDFRKPPAKCHYFTIAGQEDDRDFNLPSDVVILDDNVLHHYELVAQRLNHSTSGRQTFKAFIPQEALPGDLAVEGISDDPSQIGRDRSLRHWRLTTEAARIDLWVDEDDRLQRVSIPEAQFEALRKK